MGDMRAVLETLSTSTERGVPVACGAEVPVMLEQVDGRPTPVGFPNKPCPSPRTTLPNPLELSETQRTSQGCGPSFANTQLGAVLVELTAFKTPALPSMKGVSLAQLDTAASSVSRTIVTQRRKGVDQHMVA